MLKRGCLITMCMLLVAGCAFAALPPELLQYLSVPDPDCSPNWSFWVNSFDSLYTGDLASKAAQYTRKAQRLESIDPLEAANCYKTAAQLYQEVERDSTKAPATKALQLYQSVAASGGDCAKVEYAMAEILFYTDSKPDNGKLYERAIQLDPDFYEAYFSNLGPSGEDQGVVLQRKQRAAHFIERVLRNNTKLARDPELYYAMWQARPALGGIGDWLSSLLNLQNMWQLAADSAKAQEKFYGFFDILQLTCDSSSIALLEKAHGLKPDDVRYLGTLAAMRLGNVFFQAFDRATISKADSLGQDGLNQHIRAVYSRNRGAIDQARQELHSITARYGNQYPAAHHFLALANLMAGDCFEAYREAERSIELNPGFTDTYALLCLSYSECTGRANEQWNTATSRDLFDRTTRKCNDAPTENDCYREGYFLLKSGMIEQAQSAMTRAALFGTKTKKAAVAYAICVLAEGDVASAKSLLLTLHTTPAIWDEMPSDAKACVYQGLAVVAVAEGRAVDAIDLVAHALVENNDFPEAHALQQAIEDATR